MAAAIKGYRMILVMPENMSLERRAVMKAYGAELILTPKEGSMEAAIDKSSELEAPGEGLILDQFSNQDNPAGPSRGDRSGDLARHRRVASPTSSAPWAPPAPSWAPPAI